MKHRGWMIVTLWVVLALAACTATPAPETPIPTATETPIPTKTPKPTETSAPQIEYTWECWNGSDTSCPHDSSLFLNQMSIVSNTEVWVVGYDGYIGRWNGEQWAQMESPTNETLSTVKFLSSSNGWAAGEGGQILYWDGNEWSVIKDFEPPLLGSGNYLLWYTLEFLSEDDGWIGGCISTEGGSRLQIMHWSGIEWQDTPVSSRRHSYCVTEIDALSSDDIWAVGGEDEGLVLHWDGESWEKVPNPVNYWLYSVSALAPDDVWIAGIQAVPKGYAGTVLNWNGLEWAKFELPTAEWINTLFMLSKSDGWVGGDKLFHWNRSVWEEVSQPLEEFGKIIDIEESSDGKIWALTQHGALLHLKISE